MESLNRMLVAVAIGGVAALGLTVSARAQAPDEQDRQKQERHQKGERGERPDKQTAPQDRSQRNDDEKKAQQQRQAEQRKAQQERQAEQRKAQQERQAEQQKQQTQREQQQRAQKRKQEQQLSEQRRQQLNAQQQQRLAVQRQRESTQDRLWAQRAAVLQQQNRTAQYRFQQQYLERRRQQIQDWNARSYVYKNDPQFYSAANYRYSRGGTSYQTNQYGAESLRRAVNYGYEQGFPAGQADREDRWRSGGYQGSYAYQDGDYGYNGYHVSLTEYRHYFREGFRRGYEDGYNSRSEYGSASDGNMSILTAVLSQILNLVSN